MFTFLNNRTINISFIGGYFLLSYFESRLTVDFENFNDIKKKLHFYENLRVENLILEPKRSSTKISSDLKEKINNETNIKIYYRYNLQINDTNDFKNKVKKFNKFPSILSVESSNKDVQILAAKDSRVDIISFSDYKILRTLTPGVISLVKQNESFIEFSLALLMIKNKNIQSKNFRNLYRFIQLARNLKVNYIVSGNFKDLYDFRHPRALISICSSLLEIPLTEAKKIFKDNPKKLLERVNNRKNEDLLEPGVKIIRG